MKKTPHFSFRATSAERVLLFSIAEAVADAKTLIARAEIEKPDMCLPAVLARMWTDLLGGAIAQHEAEHPNLGGEIQQWLADSLAFWRKHREETIQAQAATQQKLKNATSLKDVFDAMFGSDGPTPAEN